MHHFYALSVKGVLYMQGTQNGVMTGHGTSENTAKCSQMRINTFEMKFLGNRASIEIGCNIL